MVKASGSSKRTRLVAIDVDGTLVERGQPVSSDVRNAITRAQQRGVIVTLASGRMYPLLAALVRDLGLTAPVICYGGAMIADAGSGQPIFAAIHPFRPFAQTLAGAGTTAAGGSAGAVNR